MNILVFKECLDQASELLTDAYNDVDDVEIEETIDKVNEAWQLVHEALSICQNEVRSNPNGNL